jgi:hypothetical protein
MLPAVQVVPLFRSQVFFSGSSPFALSRRSAYSLPPRVSIGRLGGKARQTGAATIPQKICCLSQRGLEQNEILPTRTNLPTDFAEDPNIRVTEYRLQRAIVDAEQPTAKL